MRSGNGLSMLWAAWKQHTIIWLPLGIWCALAIRGGRPFGVGDYIAFALSGLFLVYFFWMALPGLAYQRLLTALCWNREKEAAACVRFLRLLRGLGGVGVPRLELDIRLAEVLARNDKLSEAVQRLEPYVAKASGDTLLLGRLAEFWDAAGDHERACKLREQAIELTGGKGLHQIIDHAHGLVRHLRAPDLARASLARIEGRELADMPRLFVGYTRALVALEEGSFQEAEARLGRTEQAIAPQLANPLFEGMLSEVRAFHALALAGLGRAGEARAQFERARPMLEARREQALLARCRDAGLTRPG